MFLRRHRPPHLNPRLKLDRIIKLLLPLPLIPIQRPTNRLEPIPRLLLPQHRRKRKPRSRNSDIVTLLQLESIPAIKRAPGRAAGVWRHNDPEDDAVGDEKGAEGQGVGTDWGD